VRRVPGTFTRHTDRARQIQFWNQQDRADATVQAALDHILASEYRSVYSGLAICNEPVTYTDGQLSTLRGFYERSYDVVAAMADPIPMIIHDAYKGLNYWSSFLAGKNTSLVLMEDVRALFRRSRPCLIAVQHPYPG
jgi:hypothetical protein